jgi:hypothetical protein
VLEANETNWSWTYPKNVREAIETVLDALKDPYPESENPLLKK